MHASCDLWCKCGPRVTWPWVPLPLKCIWAAIRGIIFLFHWYNCQKKALPPTQTKVVKADLSFTSHHTILCSLTAATSISLHPPVQVVILYNAAKLCRGQTSQIMSSHSSLSPYQVKGFPASQRIHDTKQWQKKLCPQPIPHTRAWCFAFGGGVTPTKTWLILFMPKQCNIRLISKHRALLRDAVPNSISKQWNLSKYMSL